MDGQQGSAEMPYAHFSDLALELLAPESKFTLGLASNEVWGAANHLDAGVSRRFSRALLQPAAILLDFLELGSVLDVDPKFWTLCEFLADKVQVEIREMYNNLISKAVKNVSNRQV